MKVTVLDAKQVGAQLKRLMAENNVFHWAVAWATRTKYSKLLLANKDKINQLVIGTDFSQTCPVLLRELQPVKNVHVMISKPGITFHPKVYCFVNGKKVSVIVGSSNFTEGGTNLNHESADLLEGTRDDPAIKEHLRKVSAWWKGSEEIEEKFLGEYEARWEENKAHRKALGRPLRKEPAKKSLSKVSWSNYYEQLKNADNDHKTIDNRLAMLGHARQLFGSVSSFRQLTELQRKAIAGVIGPKEKIGTDLADFEWGLFGSMGSAGTFGNIIKSNNKNLSAALDHIPSVGDVTKGNYDSFIKLFDLAFKGQKKKGRVPTASRLLALKRPDYFICVTGKNKTGLGEYLGFSPYELDLNNYWELVVKPIMKKTRWKAKRPKGAKGEVWYARAAMLDVICRT